MIANDNDQTLSETIVDLGRGASQLVTSYFGKQLNTGETLASVTSVAQESNPTAGAGETSTLTVGSGSINTGGAVYVDTQSRGVSTCVQFRVTVPSNAAVGRYVVRVLVATSAGNTKTLGSVIRVW